MIDLDAIRMRYQATLGDWRIERLNASWNDIPALIAEVERLRAEVRRLQAAADLMAMATLEQAQAR